MILKITKRIILKFQRAARARGKVRRGIAPLRLAVLDGVKYQHQDDINTRVKSHFFHDRSSPLHVCITPHAHAHAHVRLGAQVAHVVSDFKAASRASCTPCPCSARCRSSTRCDFKAASRASGSPCPCSARCRSSKRCDFKAGIALVTPNVCGPAEI